MQESCCSFASRYGCLYLFLLSYLYLFKPHSSNLGGRKSGAKVRKLFKTTKEKSNYSALCPRTLNFKKRFDFIKDEAEQLSMELLRLIF